MSKDWKLVPVRSLKGKLAVYGIYNLKTFYFNHIKDVSRYLSLFQFWRQLDRISSPLFHGRRSGLTLTLRHKVLLNLESQAIFVVFSQQTHNSLQNGRGTTNLWFLWALRPIQKWNFKGKNSKTCLLLAKGFISTKKDHTFKNQIHIKRNDLLVTKRRVHRKPPYLASWYRPGTSSRPLSAMKVSRPQQRIKPVEKWGKPAANDISVGIEAPDDDPWYSLGDKTGSEAEVDKPTNWSEPSDSAFRKEEPSFTVLNENKTLKGSVSIKTR